MFDKNSVRNIDSVKKLANNVLPSNKEFYNWINQQKTGIFAKVFEIFDVENPEIENAFSQLICNKAIVSSGVEAEAIAASMEVVNRPRFFRSQEMRDRARKYKSVCQVGMRGLYILGENGYSNFPENINPFLRHSTYEPQQYEKYQKFLKAFNDLGLTEMKAVVNRIIKRMGDSDRGNCWLGFHRVKPDEAAATLARFHNLEWNDIFNITHNFRSFPEFTVKNDPEQEKIDNENQIMSESLFVAKAKKVKKDFKFMNLSYEPRMYPLHEFNRIPEKTQEIVELVEKMPELGNRPGFDYLWVLVPGFNLNHPSIKHQDGVYRIMIDGKVLESKDEIYVANKLDKELIHQKALMPCLMGERDGKCYLLGPWI